MEEEYSVVSMYKICPKNKDLDFCYIGQTTHFLDRKKQHIKNTINQSDKKHYHLKQYETIRNNGGWDEWEMIEIEKIKCKTNLEARIREQELITEHNANLNSLKAFITEEERIENKKKITAKFRIDNKAQIREKEKIYKEEHKDIITEQMKKYRQENKAKIYEKSKEYRENNKEKFQEINKIWREQNKEILKEKRKIYEANKKQKKMEELQQQKEKLELEQELVK